MWGVGLYPTLRGDLVCWLVVVLGSAKTGTSHSPWTSPCTRPWALEMGVWFAETYRERPSSGLSAGPRLCSLLPFLPSSPSGPSRNAGSPGYPCADGGTPGSQPPARLVQASPGHQGYGSR